MTTMTPFSDVIEFLDIVAKKNILNDNTVTGRRTACTKFVDILEDDQKTVEYVRDNLDVIKTRFSNRYKDVLGGTVDEYARRVQLVLTDYQQWSSDRAGWEKAQAAKQSGRAAESAERSARPRPPKPAASGNHHDQSADTRTVTIPIRPDADLKITMPKAGLSVAELKKLAYFLLPYANDWTPPADGGFSGMITPKLEDR
jgi:hypothetical protein